jgi:hypothetical protein
VLTKTVKKSEDTKNRGTVASKSTLLYIDVKEAL